MNMNSLAKKFLKSYIKEQSYICQVIKKPFGYLFLNTANPIYHQANHALITNEENLDSSLEDIKEFYSENNLEARIYSSFDNDQLKRIRPSLLGKGFVIEDEPETGMIHEIKVNEIKTNVLTFKKIDSFSDEFIKAVVPLSDMNYRPLAMKDEVKNPRNHFLFGFLNGLPVASAVIVDHGFGISELENVMVLPGYRRKGFGLELVNYSLDYFYKNIKGKLWLYAENKEAERVYTKAGFVINSKGFVHWVAV